MEEEVRRRASIIADHGGGLEAAIASGSLEQNQDITLSEALVIGLLRQGVRKYIAVFGHGSTDIAHVLSLYEEAGGARRYCEALAKKGMLCKETHEHTIRIAPPLCITAEEVDWALQRLAKVFEKLG